MLKNVNTQGLFKTKLVRIFVVYIYHPQTKFAKVMFLHLSVSPSVHRGGVGACMAEGRGCAWGDEWVRGLGACVAGGVHGRGVCMAGGGMCGRGCAWQGGMHATPALPADTMAMAYDQ